MYRKRLRSSTGCMRCKGRHVKCDEIRPQCSFCTRHNLTCIWPTSPWPLSDCERRQTTVTLSTSGMLTSQVTRDKNAPNLDPFHAIPMHDADDISATIGRLHSFFTGITQSTLPFDIANVHHELTRGWLASVHSDEAVCCSFVAYLAWFDYEKTTPQREMTRSSLRTEARSLALLRKRVENGQTVTDGTLLTAALHFFIATFNTKSILQLSRIAQGISALVTAKGGSSAVMRSTSHSTRQSLIFADVFNSMLTTQAPFLEGVELPAKPLSYKSLFTDVTVDTEITNCLGQDLTDVLYDMRFALFFLAPSQQTRKLSSAESRYLFMLLQRISYRLCRQQNRLAMSRSLPEIAVYGMMLVKEQVFLDITEHPIMLTSILKRFRSAISTYEGPLQGPNLTIVLWACTMALVGTEFESERTWALDFIVSALTDKYGLSWSPDWIVEARKELQRLLWHSRIEVGFTKMYTKVDCIRSQKSC